MRIFIWLIYRKMVLFAMFDMPTDTKGDIKKYTKFRKKLLEMGFLPGSQVKVVRYAPFGGPMHVQVAGYNLALRRSEAATILVDFVVW